MTRDALIETRSFRVKRFLARLGLFIAVGLIMFALVATEMRVGGWEVPLNLACSLILLWGFWGLQFLIYHRRNRL